MILITGGSGFIGSNFIHDWLSQYDEVIINIDKITYAGNPKNLANFESDSRYIFFKLDIGDKESINNILEKYEPRAILNFAAESHVDRSILGPEEFIKTNIVGTFNLLETSLKYWKSLNKDNMKKFRFFHVSTDEVYGSLLKDDPPFNETNKYLPNSPYSASKASSDHLVRSYHHTFGLPVLTSNCSNNYGPYHSVEKLIPLTISNALKGKDIPIYGNGKQIRDWLYVKDHTSAIRLILDKGKIGETYNVGGNNEKTNLSVVETICKILDDLSPKDDGKSYLNQISFVKDRPGHDARYAVDISKIHKELNWTPKYSFNKGIEQTVKWYIDNKEWVEDSSINVSNPNLESFYKD
tara:strand:- start:1770 stop:2828 length:1059 start_codon:yes stop_codon:yes gene_type:complete